MVEHAWVPRPTEIIHLDDLGGAGHEQTGHRPHLVLTTQGYNDKTSLVVCIPVTTKEKRFPFEVAVAGLNNPCFALTNHLITADWRARNAVSRGFASASEMAEVKAKVKAHLGV